jgi:methylthioribose-1-phosphate isomerase
MKIGATHYRSVRVAPGGWRVEIFDQTLLPWQVETLQLADEHQVAEAITTMRVRGAPLIGAVAAYGLALAVRRDPTDAAVEAAAAMLAATRPTAINLRWALDTMLARLRNQPRAARAGIAYAVAAEIADDDVETCRRIGEHTLPLIRAVAAARGQVNILTHCNAGWLATVDYGTALSGIFQAHDAGIPVHVWVDETRPRNQGAALTAFELHGHGVSHKIVADNAGGHLMQHGQVDMCIVGTDRVTRNGDVANKIGTYLKALAARDNDVPFHVACPHSTIDWTLDSGAAIPIEERSEAEVTDMTGQLADGSIARMRIANPGSKAANPAFDVTPARLVTSIITERGVTEASATGLARLYPEHAAR